MIDNDKLEPDEQDILDSYESGEWTSVNNIKSELLKYQSNATSTLETHQRISIILSQEDLLQIQKKAKEIGKSYQGFISDILHQYISADINHHR